MIETDIATLKAEVIALQAVLMAVFRRLASERSELTPLFCTAFDEAETILSGVGVKLGLEAPLESTVDAMRVVEELRRAVLRDETACR